MGPCSERNLTMASTSAGLMPGSSSNSWGLARLTLTRLVIRTSGLSSEHHKPAVDSPGALPRVPLDEPLGQQDEAENLRPFRNNIPHDLPPLGLRVHRSVQGNPADSRDDEKNAKRVIAQPLPHRTQEV